MTETFPAGYSDLGTAQAPTPEELPSGMLHNQTAEILTDAELYDSRNIGLKAETDEYTLKVVGEISLDVDANETKEQPARAAIIKVTSKQGYGDRFALQGLGTDVSGVVTPTKGFIALGAESLTIGREPVPEDKTRVTADKIWGPDKKFSDIVSKKHLTLSVAEGRLFVEDHSTNGTSIKADMVEADIPTHVAEHTFNAEETARLRGLINDEGHYARRKIINRNTTVGPHGEATVDIRSWAAGAEAIVVDDNNDPEAYGALYDTFKKYVDEVFTWSGRDLTEQDVLQAIYKAVKGSMAYDLSYVNQVSEVMRKEGAEHRKIDLSYYLRDGKGVCRQMALAAAWLGSEAAHKGLLQGRMTAEVNQRVADNAAHEWARYTDVDGKVWIIDPAQKYFGRLDGPTFNKNRWEYYREGERAKTQSNPVIDK